MKLSESNLAFKIDSLKLKEIVEKHNLELQQVLLFWDDISQLVEVVELEGEVDNKE